MPLFLPPIQPQPDPNNVVVVDASNAGTLYAQAQIQSIVNLVNANKAKINAILAANRGAGILK